MSEVDNETCITLVDRTTGKSYELYVSDGNLVMNDSDGGSATEFLLLDQSTGSSYEVYATNGRLAMSKGAGATGAKYIISISTLTEIGDAIRLKEGSSDPIPVADIAQRITDMQNGTDTSDATAIESHVLDGDTFYADGEKKTGSMPRHTVDNNSVTWSITSMSPGSEEAATAVTIAEGYYEEGSYPTSPLAVRFPSDITPGASDITVKGGAWFTSNFKVKGDANLVSKNIKKGVSIFGVTGSHEGDAPIETCTLRLYDVDSTLQSVIGSVIGGDGRLSVGDLDYTLETDCRACTVIPGTFVVIELTNAWAPGAMNFFGCEFYGELDAGTHRVVILYVTANSAVDADAYL